MNHLWSILYGIIQGVTEFLPVSSSGHLALLPYFAHFKDPGVFFDLAMHVGTALSVAIYFYKDVLKIIKNIFKIFNPKTPDAYFARYFVIATIITGFSALLLKDFVENYARHHYVIAFNLSVFGFLLYYIDKKYLSDNNEIFNKKEGLIPAILIGVFQTLSIFPGVSRSGITITAARYFKIDKESASRFSFLLSLPLIMAAALLKLLEVQNSSQTTDLIFCIEGVGVSFIVGILTIHFFLRLLKSIDFKYFMFYRLLLALAIIIFSVS